MKDRIEGILATLIILAYIFLTITGKAEVQGFVAIAIYVVKKYLDGIEEDKKKEK